MTVKRYGAQQVTNVVTAPVGAANYLQRGTATTAGGGSVAVVFPTPFKTAPAVGVSILAAGGGLNDVVEVDPNTVTVTGFTAYTYAAATGLAAGSVQFIWTATGT